MSLIDRIMKHFSWWDYQEYDSDRDTLSPNWDSKSVQHHYKFIESCIIPYLDQNSNLSVLDIGAGYGHWIEFYSKFGYDITAIDVGKKIVQDLRQRYDIRIHRADITEFNEGKYEIINPIGVLHHILSNAKLVQALQNIHNMLKPGGYVFIGTRLSGSQEKHRKFRQPPIWKNFLDQSGLKYIEHQRSNPPWPLRKNLDVLVAQKVE